MTRYEQGFMSKCAEYGLNEAEATALLKIAVEKFVGPSVVKNDAGTAMAAPLPSPSKNPVLNGLGRATGWMLDKFPWKESKPDTVEFRGGMGKRLVQPAFNFMGKLQGGMQDRVERYNDFAKNGPSNGVVGEMTPEEYGNYVRYANSFFGPKPTGKPAKFDQQ